VERLELVVVDAIESGSLLILGDFSFEEVLLLLEIDGFREPRERILDVAAGKRIQLAVDETAIGDVVNVLAEFVCTEADRVDW